MKSFLTLLLFFVCSKTYSQLHADNTIEIKYVNAYVKTAVDIGPKQFDSSFASGMYTDTVINKPELFAKLWNSYKDVTYDNKILPTNIRYKVILYFSVYMPPLVVYLNPSFDIFDDKGMIAKGTFLKTLRHLVDAVVYKKKI